MRVASAAFPLHPFASFAEWRARFAAMVRFAADAEARIIVFPEYVTGGLLHLDADWTRWVAPWREAAQTAARDTGLTIVAGTSLVQDGGLIVNRALIAHPDGRIDHQDKLHPTPWERRWNVAATEDIRVITIDDVPCAIPICYDIEFPEASRAAARAGAQILLVPSWTDDDHGFHRVRRCAAARCVENVVGVVHAPLIGASLAPGFEQACGAAGILTPCDVGFPIGGLAADGGWNQPVAIVAELDLPRLRTLRSNGTVTPFGDARPIADYRIAT
jgi:predicted amidohydrolase